MALEARGGRRALLSCSDKTGIVDLARGLSDLGFQILSTGGTAAQLRGAGVAVTEVAEVTGFPEILDGRVKTLHPAIHAGILARRTSDHDRALAAHGLSRIEVLAVNLYPFHEVAARAGATFEELIENIDVGGPTMLRAAAKNHEAVVVLVDPADYQPALQAIREGGPGPAERLRLALKVFRHTAAYDSAIASRLDPEAGLTPEHMLLSLERALPLRYGENPHQAAAFYQAAGAAKGFDVKKRGRELSYNNILDLDAAWTLVSALGGTCAVVIKHGNPCGAALGRTAEEAFRRAREADAESAFGCVVGLSQPLDAATARAVGESFVEVVAAPAIDAEARDLLGSKKNLRLVEMGTAHAAAPIEVRAALGGYLVQAPDRMPDEESQWKVVTHRAPSDVEREDLSFAMKVCRHVKSNAIVLAREGCTVGIGAGQMSRIDSVRIAVMKAGARAEGSVLASDAFFPFPDGIGKAREAGVTAVVQPGGSVKDEAVIAEADRLGLAMLFTGRRHFKH